MVRHLVGPPIEFPVGQGLALKGEGDRVRRFFGLAFDQMMHAQVVRPVGCGAIPLHQHLMTFAWGQSRVVNRLRVQRGWTLTSWWKTWDPLPPEVTAVPFFGW